jgi:hypothetical protein
MCAQIQQSQASVGVLIATRDEGGHPEVLLQIRADHDSYARACQVTTHGKLNDHELKLDEPEALATAVGRKLREEIGEAAAEMVRASAATPVELERVVNSKGRLVVTFGMDIGMPGSQLLAAIVPGQDVAGFRTHSDSSTILPLAEHHKAEGVPASETRMFLDEIAAVRKFLVLLRHAGP